MNTRLKLTGLAATFAASLMLMVTAAADGRGHHHDGTDRDSHAGMRATRAPAVLSREGDGRQRAQIEADAMREWLVL